MENKLKQIRESKNMSQNEVAQALHISRQSLSKWENCRGNPDIENLVALSKLYDVSINELIDGIELPYQENNSENDNTVNNDTLKILCYFSIVILSTFISVIGIGVSLFLLIKLRKQSYHKLFYIVCILCFLISMVNFGILLNSVFFEIGTVIIQ